ncbi:helix-turn-helix domain-containing protein [Streptomyces graminilatus]|uniref:helix-turn-helix domain-containing protein n=1 Tax=Streptomyces graminilatus TaxID=1464070 RepID=UPI0006E23409|nr:helix-turn-helix domain-containing protein [Streptomyces graminilatus]
MDREFGQPCETGQGAGDAASSWQHGRGVLEGAFQLMAALDRVGQARPTRLTALSGLPKTTALRLLRQLADLGAVEQLAGTYRMGPRVFRLGQGWEPCPGLRAASREPVRRLVAATGATVGISVLSEGRTLILEWTAGQDAVLAPLLDVVSWPWFTAAGKAQAAAGRPGPPADPADVVSPTSSLRSLGPLPPSWPHEAAAIRAYGAALDRGEVVEGVCWAAVPLLGKGGGAVGALCALTRRPERLEPLANIAQRAGEAVTARLRHRRTNLSLRAGAGPSRTE